MTHGRWTSPMPGTTRNSSTRSKSRTETVTIDNARRAGPLQAEYVKTFVENVGTSNIHRLGRRRMPRAGATSFIDILTRGRGKHKILGTSRAPRGSPLRGASPRYGPVPRRHLESRGFGVVRGAGLSRNAKARNLIPSWSRPTGAGAQPGHPGQYDAIICLGELVHPHPRRGRPAPALAEFYAALKHDGTPDPRPAATTTRSLDQGLLDQAQVLLICGGQGHRGARVHGREGLARFQVHPSRTL